MIKELSRITFFLFLSLSLVMISCDDDDDEDPPVTPSGPTQNIADLAQDSDQFSILVEALAATDLVTTLEGDGPFTVFAPDNDAFTEYFAQQNITDDNNDGSFIDEATATPEDTEDLKQTLLYHVIIGSEIREADISSQTYATTGSTDSPEGDGLSLLAEPSGSTVLINGGNGNMGDDKGATVTAADILATNGVIHEIDGVLERPTVVDHAIFNSDLSELVEAVVATDLVTPLNSASELTVFAPLNSAFEEIETTVAGLTTDQLTDVLQYHVLPIQIRAEQISVGSQPTLEGEMVTIGVESDDVTVTVTDVNGGETIVVLTNIQGTNGVVHVIDGVLIPTL
jgi:transforming growth factor-beta-induced protein